MEMADPRDPKDQKGKFSEDPDQQSPKTPAPTPQSQAFLAEEEVEPHEDKGHYDTVSDIKVGHAGIPKFLKIVYATLAVWGVYYALFAQPVDDRMEAAPSAEPTVEAGAEAFATSCAACHNITAERKIGPGLAGSFERLGEEELHNVLKNGRPDKGMPAPPSLGLNDKQIESLFLYIKTLK
jgi:mono/diheme cytochrome c family protein